MQITCTCDFVPLTVDPSKNTGTRVLCAKIMVAKQDLQNFTSHKCNPNRVYSCKPSLDHQ